jgi:hypothetical protein
VTDLHGCGACDLEVCVHQDHVAHFACPYVMNAKHARRAEYHIPNFGR